jgi:hypothetical protein
MPKPKKTTTSNDTKLFSQTECENTVENNPSSDTENLKIHTLSKQAPEPRFQHIDLKTNNRDT